MPSARQPAADAAGTPTNASHFTSIPWPLQNVRWRAWFRTADSKASERPWNHSRSASGQVLDVSATCESAAGPSAVSLSKIAATGFSTTASSMLSSPRARSTSSISLWRRPANDDSSRVTWRHREAPAADELEERRRQLVAARDDALGEQRRHERGRQVVRRLVHVLRRRAGRVLAAEAPVREPAEQPRGNDREGGRPRGSMPTGGGACPRARACRAPRARRRPARVRSSRPGRCRARGARTARRAPAPTGGYSTRRITAALRPARRRPPPSTSPRAHRHAWSSQAGSIQRARAGQRARGVHVREQVREPALPLIAPDLRRHLDGVVVGDDDAAQAVAQRERALAAVLLVVPDDAQALRAGAPRRSVPAASLLPSAVLPPRSVGGGRPRSPRRRPPSRPSPAGCRGRRR